MGGSTAGYSRIPSLGTLTMPNRTITRDRTMARTGRLMLISERVMASGLPRSSVDALFEPDGDTRPQPQEVAGQEDVALLQAGENLHVVRGAHSDPDLLLGGLAVPQQEHAVALDRGHKGS